MKVLVTGANGYLGQGIVKALADKGCDVVATDFKCDTVDNRAKKIECDIFSIENPYGYFGNPDVVLHLAWRDGFVHYSQNHIGDLPKHHAFLESMVKSGAKRLTVMGSMHEVGFFEGSINENTPCKPLSLYGVGKNALRQICEILAKQNDVTLQWIRGYYIVGNSRYGCSIFSKITEAAERGDKEFPFTTGQNQYDFLDYGEFCEQVASVTVQEAVNGIINICSGKPEKLADRVERFIKENNYRIKLNYGAFPDRPYDSKAVWGDNSKIQKILKG